MSCRRVILRWILSSCCYLSIMDIKFPVVELWVGSAGWSWKISWFSSFTTRRLHPICLFVLITLFTSSTVCSGIKVKNLTVPQTYILDHNTVGAPKPLILDCEYETDPRDTGIVLKWFFNNFPIYQWIPNSHPIQLPKFKPHLDTTYTVEDPKQVYRALSIQNPTWNMTGNYTCSLQSFRSSDQQSAQLIVIGKSDGVAVVWSDARVTLQFSTVFCRAREGFRFAGGHRRRNGAPQLQRLRHLPQADFVHQVKEEYELCFAIDIILIISSVNGRHVHGIVTDNESTRPTNGLYEVKLEVSLNKTQIVVPANINCLLEIPATDYMRERTETYNGEIRRAFLVVPRAWLLLVDYPAASGWSLCSARELSFCK